MNNVKLIDCGFTYQVQFKKKAIGSIKQLGTEGNFWQISGEEKIYKSMEEAIAILVARHHLKDFQGTGKASKGRIVR